MEIQADDYKHNQKSAQRVPQNVVAYATCRPEVIQWLWFRLDQGDALISGSGDSWTTPIGEEPAKGGTGVKVYWVCSWSMGQGFFKRIPSVEDVAERRFKGGEITVAPQEFGLIPDHLTWHQSYMPVMTPRWIALRSDRPKYERHEVQTEEKPKSLQCFQGQVKDEECL